MKQKITAIISTFYDEDGKVKLRMVCSVMLILLGVIIMGWYFLSLLISNEDYFGFSNDINLSSSGLVGDFIGGLAGTLFTLVGIILLFETLSLQRIELTESRKVFERQQFETTFFNLLNLYSDVVKGLHYTSRDYFEDQIHNGKEFFEKQQKDFYDNFVTRSDIQKNRKEAAMIYIAFYSNTKEQTAHYFRTIYRVFRFIDNCKFDDKDKDQYAKIVRAQLSESELFFIHYNAFTEYGSKFRRLINNFNITKHLPAIEKVEFKKYASILTQLEKNGVQLVFDDIRRFIKSSLKESKTNYKTYLQGRVAIKTKSTKTSEFTVQIIKKINFNMNFVHQQGSGLQQFDEKGLENLFVDFIHDLLSYSNYFELNGKHIRITNSNSTNFVLSKHTIEISAKNQNDEPIKFN
jgi:hypothetical protein